MFGIFKRVADVEQRVENWALSVVSLERHVEKLEKELIAVAAKNKPLKRKAKPVCKFKKGDKVQKQETGEIDTVVATPGMKDYDSLNYIEAHRGFQLKNNGWEFQEDWNLAPKKKRGRPRKIK